MQYHAPTSVDDALRLLAAGNGNCQILAGGTDLLVRLRSEMGDEPESILDIKRIEELRTITPEAGGWRIGAAVSGAEMGEHPALVADWPGVVEAMNLIGSTQIQGRATLAGNLCNASPAADSVPAMVAAGAMARIAGPDGARDIPSPKYRPDQAAHRWARPSSSPRFIFRPAPKAAADAYLRFTPAQRDGHRGGRLRRRADAGRRGHLHLGAGLAGGRLGPVVMLVEAGAGALVGTEVDDAALDALAAACSDAASPIDDKRGTVAFRTHVAGVLARRAASIAKTRAGGAS